MKARTLRIIAVIILGGLAALGAGNIPFIQQDAIASFLFGASMVGLFVATGLLAIFALKGEVTNIDFDDTMKSTVQNIQSKQNDPADKE